MRKVILPFLCILMIISLCSCAKTFTFNAVIEDVNEGSLLVATKDDVSFDRASVDISDVELNFEPAAGQKVIITALDEIKESYPVQITATKVELDGD